MSACSSHLSSIQLLPHLHDNSSWMEGKRTFLKGGKDGRKGGWKVEKVEEKLKPWLFSPLPPSLHLQFRRRPPTPSKYKCERRFVISGNIALTSIYHYVAIILNGSFHCINHQQWAIIITLLSSSAGTSMATLPGELGLPSWGFVIE